MKGSWELIFNENFDGQELDQERWTTCYWWDKNGCTNLSNKELQWYLPANVQVADGNLQITARPEKVTGHEDAVFPYTSGIITTGQYYLERKENSRQPRFATQYGYFEMRAKVPAGRGLWPAFWLLPVSQQSKPEIDIMEVLGHEPDVLQMHVHYRDQSGKSRSVGHDVKTADLSKDWHTYGLLWEAGKIIWYLNGEEKWRYTGPGISKEPMYLLVNLAVGGKWPGSPDSETVFPADYFVDYVRVWKRRAER